MTNNQAPFFSHSKRANRSPGKKSQRSAALFSRGIIEAKGVQAIANQGFRPLQDRNHP
jgi:hypothetical protein